MKQFIDIVKNIKKNIEVKLNEQMSLHTSFKIGGSVNAMFLPKDSMSLVELLSLSCEHEVKPFIMGNGTNLLVQDGKLDMLVINTTDVKNIEIAGDTIKADAGALLSKIAILAYENDLTGFEFAHGIPGTLGGAVLMNAGAYGNEIKDVLSSSTAYSSTTGVYEINNSEHNFSYRQSSFSTNGDVILSSTIKLKKGNKENIKQKMDKLSRLRKESQPLDIPSAGSTFKRPKKGYAAELIDEARLKGYTVGGAMVSAKHAGFVINCGGATFDDVMAVINHVQETVLSLFNIELELEVKVCRGR
ncbi:MAG: UDP-N-acetylmuramate dehydrogenase [Oscillospiraceae bacterium]|nr:UDP-N-acetylmuramate dehydrogenase [Oscillospiraceae bacterium]